MTSMSIDPDGTLARTLSHHFRQQLRPYKLPNPCVLKALAADVYHQAIPPQRQTHQLYMRYHALTAEIARRILVAHAQRMQEAVWKEILVLDEGLTEMATQMPRPSEVGELRIFGCLSVEEAADVLGISPLQAMRAWRKFKQWFRDAEGGIAALEAIPPDSPPPFSARIQRHGD